METNNINNLEESKENEPYVMNLKVNEENKSCFQKLVTYLKGIPLFVGFILITTFILYFFTLLLPDFTLFFSNRPYRTIQKSNFWTIITSVFINSKIIVLIFTFLAWISDAIRLENCNGSIRYMFNFFINSIIIQMIYTLLSYLLSFIFFGYYFGELLEKPSHGLLPVVMAEITILSLANTEIMVTMFFIPFPFKAKFYPWAYFGFFILVGGFVVLIDIISGIAYGYLFFYFLRRFIDFSDEFIQKVEDFLCCKYIAKLHGKF